jgi:histidine triad (HIT) family protein
VRDGCPFCDYDGPSRVLWQTGSAERGVFVVAPVNPVTVGHVLVIPRLHVEDFMADPITTALVMGAAADYAQGRLVDCNLITSKGLAATQTVKHLHVHLVPRWPGDGLALPWS